MEFKTLTEAADYVDDLVHDLNNSIGGIQGYSQYLLKKLPETDPNANSANEILKAAQRSLDYVKKILEFTREYRTKK